MIGCIIGISLLVLTKNQLQQGSSKPNNIRRQLLIDPKSVELRSDIQYSPPPLPQEEEQLDTSLVRSVLNGRSDTSKDALIGMWTMTTLEHRQFAREAVQRINENKIIGDIVECGVWMGGMTMLMVFENMKSDITRHFWLFDTFDGLPEPDVKDGTRANKIYNDLQTGVQSKKIVNDHKHGTMLNNKWN